MWCLTYKHNKFKDEETLRKIKGNSREISSTKLWRGGLQMWGKQKLDWRKPSLHQ